MKHLISRQSLKRKPSAIRALQPLMKDGMILMGAGLPNAETFPLERLQIKVGGKELTIDQKALQYGPTLGFKEVLDDLREIQGHNHGRIGNFDIIIGNGSQTLITKGMEMLLDPEDTILVEKPCYSGILAFLDAFECHKEFIKTNENGVDSRALHQLLSTWPSHKKKPKCLYTVPTGNNPTGSCTPLQEKQDILKLAIEHDFVILEDDPYFYLQYGPRLQSYFSLDTTGHVLRFESFSKILSSGIRLGFASGHPTFIHQLMLHMQCTELQATSLSQLVFHAWYTECQLNGFQSHIDSICEFYKAKRDILVNELHKNGIECTSPLAGMFLWLKVPPLQNEQLMMDLLKKNVMVLSGHVFNDTDHIRLTFATPTTQQMIEAVQIIKNSF